MNILIMDFSQLARKSCSFITSNESSVDVDMILKPIYASIHKLRKKFPETDEIILAIDSPHSWRKDFFPPYKANRKITRDKSDFDWSSYYDSLREIIEMLKEYYPAKVVSVYGAEGDDIIAVLTKYHIKKGNKVTIVSSDKDFFQLKRLSKDVEQWCPRDKSYINFDGDTLSLGVHVLKGDNADGIPNILSDDDTYINPDKSTKRFKKADMERWKDMSYKDLMQEMLQSEEHKKNFIRNVKIIDFNCIPKKLTTEIIEEYENAKKSNPKFRSWVIKKGLADVM